MPETWQTSFLALSVYPGVGIILSASKTEDRFYCHGKNLGAELNKLLPMGKMQIKIYLMINKDEQRKKKSYYTLKKITRHINFM